MSTPHATVLRAAVIAVTALVAIVILGPSSAVFGPSSRANAAPVADSTTPIKGITVEGIGKVTVAPDLATVGVGVQTQAATAAQAQAQASAAIARITSAVRGRGVATADMTSEWISLQPQYAYEPAGSVPPRVTGYQANQSLSVKVRAIDQTGAIIDAAVAAGATQVSGISFSVADRTAAMARARTAAMADARQRAASLAQAAGVTLGSVISISEVSAPTPVPFANGAMAAPSVQTPVQPGTTELEVDVQATFSVVG